MKTARLKSTALRICVKAAALVTVLALAFIVGYILVRGVPSLKPSLFALEYNSENVSLLPALINTIYMTALSLVISVPLGVFAAIYLVEYAKRGSKLVKLVRLTAETLSGIPSIVYGLFGMLFFVKTLKMGTSLIAGALTLSIMILPLIMRTTEEALIAVPDAYREGAFGLGAGRLRTVFKIVLPSATSGILAGVILAIGRIVGETAALIYTSGTVPETATSLGDSARTLSNLVDNAIKYNVAGGSVSVAVKREGERAVLTVADTGIGIPDEQRERVFERFYRVDKSHSKQTGGTGLGLAIVKHAVAAHGARITLESEPHKGTTISVAFDALN